VETNFRVYAEIENFLDSDYVLNLLSKFCRIEYRFQQLIVGVLERELVVKFFECENGITADMLIEFFKKCSHSEVLKKI